MLHNEKVRDIIDTVARKAVLILGRFTDERKAVLDALRVELRKRDYLPILFDFAVPATRDIAETVSLLARMARFIIADLTDPSSIPKELEAIVPSLAVPVQQLLEGASRPYAMFKDYWKYEWVLPVYRYEGLEPLLAAIAEKVIAPAEGKVKALAERRRRIEAELTKPQQSIRAALDSHQTKCHLQPMLMRDRGAGGFLSTAAVLMCLAGSRFSSDSAHRPFHHWIRGRSGTIYWAALPSEGRQVHATKRTHLIHRPARDIIPPLGGARVFSYRI
jgi:hypothetical protein